MKKSLRIFITSILILIASFSFSQNQKIENDNIKYFDENYNLISKTEYENRKWKNSLLNIQGDSINHKILTVRTYEGRLKNKKNLDSLLSSTISNKIDSSKTIVIIYYPGKDPCNSSGSATKSSKKTWFKELEKKLYKITQTKPIYIYKDKDGIEKYDEIMTWYKDPYGTIEKLFFKYHYPCSSFVVISKEGEFISYFGEFSKEYVWKAAEILTKK
jgi:hypothetical protein